jgi:hypothetical protein
MSFWSGLREHGANVPDDVAGSRSFLSDAFDCRPRFFQVWRVAREPHHAGIGIGDDCGQRLVYLV